MIYNKVIVFERRMFDMVFDVIDLKEIKSMFTNPVYQRGLKYFQDGRVKDLFHDQVRDCWYAKVSGSKSYQVEIWEAGEEISCECSCPAFDQYWEPCSRRTSSGKSSQNGTKESRAGDSNDNTGND